MQTSKHMKPNIQRLCEIVENKTRRNFSFAPDYAEPGYDSPKAGIVFGNWNPACGFNVPKEQQRRDPVLKLARILEKQGFELKWEDEWTTCEDCGKAVRTHGNCYQWTSYFRILNECELICLDCLDWAEYLKSIEDNPHSACPPEIDPTKYGYEKHNGDFETGFHAHMTDDPKKLLKELHAQGKKGIVFRIKENFQFYTTWEAYVKTETNEE